MAHKIAALDNLHLLPSAEAIIQELYSEPVVFPRGDTHPSPQELVARTNDADIILISPGTKITTQYLEKCPTVKYIGLCGTSTTDVDLDAVSRHGIKFTKVIDYGDEPTAEFVFMQLSFLKGISA